MPSSLSDGAHFAPVGKPAATCRPGEFVFAAMALDHGHIYGQTNGLREAGGLCKWVYDADPAQAAKFQAAYPDVKIARSEAEILDDPQVQLVAAAAIPNLRADLGIRVMRAGKDYFTDKTPMTSLDQLARVRAVCAQTKRIYAVYFSERLHQESAVYAGQLIERGTIGKVVQVIGTGPHRLGAGRPAWFFRKENYGGILTDIGSHQVEQFLTFTGNRSARVLSATASNVAHPEHPELQDLGDFHVLGGDGTTGYHRVDWLTPAGLRTWGDGKLIILGTEGFIELRKYVDLAAATHTQDICLWADTSGEHRFDCLGKVGFPYFGQLIRDCLDRTETAMRQEHTFLAAQLCLEAQALADASVRM